MATTFARVVIGATNHPHLLDPAIWRRFPYKAELLVPDSMVRTAMWRHFLYQDGDDGDASAVLARLSEGMAGADIENFAHAARRRAVIGRQDLSLPHILLAIASNANGLPKLPDNRALTADEKKLLAQLLVERLDMPQTEIARTLGVSRQMVHRYLKGCDDG